MVVVKVDSFTLLLTILQICPETENNEKHFGIVAILLDATHRVCSRELPPTQSSY